MLRHYLNFQNIHNKMKFLKFFSNFACRSKTLKILMPVLRTIAISRKTGFCRIFCLFFFKSMVFCHYLNSQEYSFNNKVEKFLTVAYFKQNIGDPPIKRREMKMALFYLLQQNIVFQLRIV